MAKKTSQQTPNKGNDLIIKEYEFAISLIQYHTELLWLTFGSFLLAETVLIGFLGTALYEQNSVVTENIVVFIGSLLGFIICILWYATFQHNYTYYELRILQARKCESELGYKLLQDGQKLSSGKFVNIGEATLRLPTSARHLPPRTSVKWLIILFGIIFFILLFITGPWW